MNKTFLFFLIFITKITCIGAQNYELYRGNKIHEVFEEQEIIYLDMIVECFDSILLAKTNNQDISQAYNEYFNKLKDSESLKDLWRSIALSNSDNISALIKNFKRVGLFDEIWEYSYEYKYKSNDTLALRLSLNLQGKYVHLLKLLSQNNFFKTYYNSLIRSGYIDPSMVAIVMKEYKKVDFRKAINRLVWAIHYITILSEIECKNE